MKINCKRCKVVRAAIAWFSPMGIYKVTCLRCGRQAGQYDLIDDPPSGAV